MADDATAGLLDAIETVITRALAPVVGQVGMLQASIIDAAANVVESERRIAALESARVDDKAAVSDLADAAVSDLADVRARIAALETREPVPGPPGPAGADGLPGMTYKGVWTPGDYRRGDVVTRDGSMWHCNADTSTRPGDGGPAWTLAVKRGRDGSGRS